MGNFDFNLSEAQAAELVASIQKQQAAAAPPVAPPPPATPPVAETSPPADPAQAPDALPNKLRLRTNGDPLAVHAVNIYNERTIAGNPITLAKAESLAREVLGLNAATDVSGVTAPPAPQTATPPVQQPPPAATPPASIQAIDTQADALQEEFARVNDLVSQDYNPARAAEIQKALYQLASERALAQITAQQATQTEAAQQAAEAEFQRQWQASYTQAAQAWPALSDPASPIHLLAAAMQQAAFSPDHADHAATQTGESAMYFARKAAAALNLAPVAGATPTAAPVSNHSPAPQVSVSSHTPSLATLLGGGQSPPTAPSPGADAAELMRNLSATDWNNLAYYSQAGAIPVR